MLKLKLQSMKLLCQAKKTAAKGRALPKLEAQALLEEYLERMVCGGREGGLRRRRCRRGRSEFYASRRESKCGEAAFE